MIPKKVIAYSIGQPSAKLAVPCDTGDGTGISGEGVSSFRALSAFAGSVSQSMDNEPSTIATGPFSSRPEDEAAHALLSRRGPIGLRPAAASIMKAAQSEQVQEKQDEFNRFPFGSRPRGSLLARLSAHTGAVRGVSSCDDGTFAVSIGEDGSAAVWDAIGLATFRGHTDIVP